MLTTINSLIACVPLDKQISLMCLEKMMMVFGYNFMPMGLPVYFSSPEETEEEFGEGRARLDRRPNLGDFDSDSVKNIDAYVGCSIGFLDTLTIELIEDDSEFRGSPDHIFAFIGFSAGRDTYEPLQLDETERLQDTLTINGEGGIYRFTHNLAHGSHDISSGPNKPTVMSSSPDTSMPAITCAS